ncbi:MAG: rod shape-determining protein RodA [Candidatus Omnitrophica bacterium]|nr:rod shape-determining protein RodA [Candidatus Omnitrophota bacterium]
MWVIKVLKGFNWGLFFCALSLSFIGLVFIASAKTGFETDYVMKQIMWIGMGVVMCLLVVWVGYRPFLNLAPIFYGISIMLLVLVMLTGVSAKGAQRWLDLGFIALQPSEFCKLATILTLARFLGANKPTKNQWFTFAIASVIVLFPLGFILKQPDLGTALIFVPIFFLMLYVWGAKLRYLLGTIAIGLASMPVFWLLLKEYQKRRLLVFINPNVDPVGAGYNTIQSKIAVGSGMMFGKGWFQGTQNRLRFIPEHHTDFIFSVIGEEWGFIGSMALLLVFLLFFWRAMMIGNQTTDMSGRLLVVGIVSMLAFHVFVNIGMTIGIMPITGLPLPFISYGGSSLISAFISVGLLISVYRTRSIF